MNQAKNLKDRRRAAKEAHEEEIRGIEEYYDEARRVYGDSPDAQKCLNEIEVHQKARENYRYGLIMRKLEEKQI